jgi:hypothetical protein
MADAYFPFAFVTKLDPHFPQFAQRRGVPPSWYLYEERRCRPAYIHLWLLRNFFEDKELGGSAGSKVSLIVAEEK